jgi:methylamine dehydrogenase heavy chain
MPASFRRKQITFKEGYGQMSRQTSQAFALRAACLLMAGAGLAIGAAGVAPAAVPTEPETATVATLPAPSPKWFYVRGGFDSAGTQIVDSTTGKMVGMVDTSRSSDMAIDPAGKFYYVSETIWSKGNRGTRQDLLTIYDANSLKLQTEVTFPGRLIIGAQVNNFALSEDGKSAYIFNLTPAASVNIVDLVKRKFSRNVELPGCAGLMPIPEGLVSVCSDGSLASLNLSGKGGDHPQRAVFHATNDPVFDAFNYSIKRKEAVFISYTGLIYTAKIGLKPEIAAPFSIQAAAGLRPGDTKPLDVNWLPGGRQLTAWHHASNHLYVLMHMGEFWTQKDPGEEIWDVDLSTKKVVKRFPLEDHIDNIAVTQGDKPKLFINTMRNDGYILDLATWTLGPKIGQIGGGIIATVEAP